MMRSIEMAWPMAGEQPQIRDYIWVGPYVERKSWAMLTIGISSPPFD
jgi:hypothetical protein